MKPFIHFHRFFITLSCSLIMTGVVFASDSSIMQNQRGHAFPVTPVIKKTAFTQIHSEEKPLESLARYVIENGKKVDLYAELISYWNLPDDEEFMTGYQIRCPTEEDPQWSFVVRKSPKSQGYDIIIVEWIEGGLNFFLTSEIGKLRRKVIHAMRSGAMSFIPKEKAENALATAIDDWQEWHRQREPDG